MTTRAKVMVVVASMAMACGACSSSDSQADDAGATSDARDAGGPLDWDGGPLFPRCIGDWPDAPAFSFEPSIEGAALEMLWTKSFDTGPLSTGLALAGQRLAFTAGFNIYILDLEGNLVAQTSTAEIDYIFSGPSADTEGNFYFSGARAYSVDSEGQSRWSHAYGENISNRFEGTWARRFVISPEGVAYTAATDGFLYAFDTEDGSLVWSQDVGLWSGGRPVGVGPGVGDTLFVYDETQTYLYDKESGEMWGRVPTLDGKRLSPAAPSYGGQVIMMRNEDHPDEIQSSYFFLDECGDMQWSLESGRDWYPSVYLPGDSLVALERDVSVPATPTYANVFSPSGERLLGPIPGPVPLILGADGVGYDVSCVNDESTVTAVDSQLNQLGTLSLGSPCWSTPKVLSDSGVLYLSRHDDIEGRTDVLAVQTASPGLANTSRPTPRHDNRGSRWLAPIEPVQ